jgi:hypothetical protein
MIDTSRFLLSTKHLPLKTICQQKSDETLKPTCAIFVLHGTINRLGQYSAERPHIPKIPFELMIELSPPLVRNVDYGFGTQRDGRRMLG